MHAQFKTEWVGGNRQTRIEVEFVTRGGSIHRVQSKLVRPHLTTGTTRRRDRVHQADTLAGIRACEAVDLHYWGAADQARCWWAVGGGRWFLVHYVPQRALLVVSEVDAWGTRLGWSTEVGYAN